MVTKSRFTIALVFSEGRAFRLYGYENPLLKLFNPELATGSLICLASRYQSTRKEIIIETGLTRNKNESDDINTYEKTMVIF